MKLKMLSWAFVLCVPVCLSGQTTVSAAPDAATREDVKKLFDVMASREQIRQMLDQLSAQTRALTHEQLKKQHPEISDEELARADRQSEDLLKSFPVDEMLDDMIPVYQRHFTRSDIEALTAFYSSPAGQKFLREMPGVTAETMRTIYPRLQAMIDAATKHADEKGTSPKN